MMTAEAWITAGILAATFALLLFSRFPAHVIFLGALTAAITFGLAPVEELLKGFSNQGVLTVAVLFMIAEGMYSTGAITMISDRIVGLPKSILGAQFKILPPVAAGSAFFNNTPLVAMMIPVVRDLSRSTGLDSSKIYIPLSYASILGGASTLIGTSSNLIIAGLVLEQIAENDPGAPVLERITIFVPTLVGLPVAIAGIVFLFFIGTKLLPRHEIKGKEEIKRRLYRAEFFIAEDSYLAGKTIEKAGFASPTGYSLNSVRRGEEEKHLIEPSFMLRQGDVLTFFTNADGLPALWATIGLTPLNTLFPIQAERHRHRLVEVVISPRSSLVGRSIEDLPETEEPYEAAIVAISRSGEPLDLPLREVRIMAGDSAVLEVEDSFFYHNRNETEFIIVKRLRGYRVKRTDRAIAAIVITGAMVAAAAFGLLTIFNAALLATFAMLATGCMSIRRATKSIEWNTVVVLGCAVGLEAAVTESGLADVLANLISSIGGSDPYVALAVVFVSCIIMTNVITNAAAAAFMFPIALSIAGDLGTSFMPFAVALMLGTSYSFLNPAGYQTNLMVFEPGGYAAKDYIKVGLPLTILVSLAVILLTPLIYEF
ncbi:MAG: SLC13 family permease [Methanosarcinaceae archaeon]